MADEGTGEGITKGFLSKDLIATETAEKAVGCAGAVVWDKETIVFC